ncbi:hypothetical protein ACPUYX_07195 [Desulfosporosinus sp. SYSU MS00001]|uniref:hypothetical protein n=1 Tax=Desulfosporosinus sp. SYSU MS00001 TaxID=3416284 RepID=UPI003CFA3C23
MNKIGLKTIIIIFFVLQTVTILGMLKQGNSEYVSDVAFTTVLITLSIIFGWKYIINTNTYGVVLVFITLVCHSLFGEYIGLYNTSSIFDKILHFFGTYSFTYYSYLLIKQIFTKGSVSKSREFIFIAAMGMALGALFEIFEFLLDIVLTPKIPYQSSLMDTDLDLICDFFGAIIASLHLNSSLVTQCLTVIKGSHR